MGQSTSNNESSCISVRSCVPDTTGSMRQNPRGDWSVPMSSQQCNPKSFATPMSSARRMWLQAALLLTVVGFVVLGPSLRAQNTSGSSAGTPAVDPVVQQNMADWAAEGKGVVDDR